MALRAGLREAGLHLVGLRCALEVFQVAAHASGVRAGQVVVVIDVALGTLHAAVRTGKREARRGVIEGRSRPIGGAMALFAGLGNSRGDVIRIRRAPEILQMAADTRSIGDAVIVVGVAALATDAGVGSS